MLRLLTSLCVLGLPLVALAEGPDLKEARQRWLRGNYEEARAAYEELARDAKHRAAATVGLSRVAQSQGDYERALKVIDEALAAHPKDASLHARRAEVLYLRGRWDDAVKAAERAIALDDEQFPARWVRAQVLRDRGELEQADAEFRWFVRTYSRRSNEDNDIKDPDQLILVGLAGAENARWHQLSDQFHFILTEVYGDALKYDKDLWVAEYQAGLLLLEKYNRGEALDAFDKALAINPNAAEALVGKGQAALQKYEVKEAEQAAEQALKVNPNLPEALRLRADVHLVTGDVAAAVKELELARKVNPRDERTLGRLAACLVLRRQGEAFDALVKEVHAADTKPGVFYAELADRLEDRRWFDEAEKYYRKAAELRPRLWVAQNGLGLLYMRLGREAEARDILTKAFEADPFNVRVSNTLKVLRHLDRYETLKTDHFKVRYDPKNDAALARYMASYLEDIYADLAEKFQYRAKGPILVEVFNSHQMFSGRTVALPDLHTIGACTGKMVAMASTHAKGVRKPFNWARVLRHELVHIFNLEQTRYQVPHWLTEGLAVSNEGFPRPQQWNQILLAKVPKGELLTLEDIDLGFIRPRSPQQWHQAYCQSQLYVQYLQEQYGPAAVGEMLTAYRDGLDTAAALQKACKTDRAAFEKGYRDYLAEVVKSLKGRQPETAMTFSELKAAHEKEPGDLGVKARLAEAYLRRDRVEARKLAEAVLEKEEKHPLASYVKARLLLLAGDTEGAREFLQAALDPGDPEPKVLRELGKQYFEAKDFARAEEIFELGRRAEPYDSQWLQELARVHAQAGQRAKLVAVLKELVPLDADDLEHRKRLASLLLEDGQHELAEKYARQALEIDVRDREVRETLYQALHRQDRGQELEEVRKLLEQ